MTAMNDRSQTRPRWKGSLSQGGVAWSRALLAIVLVVGLIMIVARLFPTREERLWKFVEDARLAFVEKRDDDLFAAFDPAVRYQKTYGLAEIRRDVARYRSAELPPPHVAEREVTFDATGAEVRLVVVISVELRPIARVTVRLRVVDDDGGPVRVTSIAWE
jgi:hypothetical protein